MGIYFFDEFSLLHLASGIIFQYFDFSFIQHLYLHILFEILENTQIGISLINKLYSLAPGLIKTESDSLINSFGDVIYGIIGWLIAYYFRKLFNKNS
jgi:hypothetical protein